MIGTNAIVSIFNMVYGTSTNTYPSTANITGLPVFIEAQRSELVAVLGQGFNAEVYIMYCDPVTIEAGDKVTDDLGIEYRVTGIEKHENNQDTDNVYSVTLHKQKSTTH